jgi:hypothetical protein
MAPDSSDSGPFTGRAIIAALAAFAGATGLLAAIGFLVHQTLFILVGLPSPPFATTDYLRIAGLFLFDVGVFVILRQAATLVLPALLPLLAVAAWAALWGPRPKTWTAFARRYQRVWAVAGRFYQHRFQGSLALSICLLALVVFTFTYNYPVFEQRDIFFAPPRDCGDPERLPTRFWSLTKLWLFVDCAPERMREIVLDPERINEAQSIYRGGVTWLAVLALYTLFHPYSQFRSARGAHSTARRSLWSVTAAVLFLSLPYLLSGYAILFSQKHAPLVKVSFKDERKGDRNHEALSAAGAASAPREPSWQTEITTRTWYLLFQNDKEIWLFRRPIAHIIPKDQVGLITIRRRAWFLEP